MTRIRMGVDVVSISRLERRLSEWPRLAERIFTPQELKYARGRNGAVQHLAARFAAKEAAFKALGSGWPMLSWMDVEVVSEGREPTLLLSGRAETAADGRIPIVSLSHDGDIALAQVLLLEG